MKTRAAVLHTLDKIAPFADSRPLAIEEVELDAPGPGEVLVKMTAAGLCHSDLSVITGVRPRPVPMALGHEASASVLQVGAGVHDLKPGDHVVLVFVPSCGHCLPCMEGRPALCEPGAEANGKGELLSGERRLHVGPQAIHHHMGISAFAEHAVVSRRSCVKIEQDIDPVEAALFGCAVLTGVGAVVNTAKLQPGQSAAVVGLGGVGMCSLLGAAAAGAKDIVAIDLHDSKLAKARELGATFTVNARDPDAIAKVKEATRGGVDVAFEMAGVVAAMELSYRITKRGGMTVTASLPHPQHQWPLQQVSLVAEERTVKGSYIGSCVPARDVPRYIGLYLAGRLPVNKLLGERLPLADINRGFDRLDAGESMRDLVVF
ncbi:MAG: zinc-dependent alcohol dehydrogenase family protein [Burkholderiaceae bacterium]|nr:zinc-dependent alcohol dehydrogenase family protein [Burkholderiaceae bacterium]